MANQDISPAEAQRGAVANELWHVSMPVLPSQILKSYTTSPPPRRLLLEGVVPSSPPHASSSSEPHLPVQGTSSIAAVSHEPSFAETANGLINEILDRSPTGDSVVDPDSVIGESLRLYHGYKDGK
ncbi:hypothetical protein BX600DRAFT_430409 [Xylariales sp. PMI_506]|nr:hypothetical protein BX600DRAFT_430409 [Xylariales sp. PMI_506]